MMLTGKILRNERHKTQMDRFLKPGCSFQKRAANHRHLMKNS